MHVGRTVTRAAETCTIDESAASLATRILPSHVGDLVVIEYLWDRSALCADRAGGIRCSRASGMTACSRSCRRRDRRVRELIKEAPPRKERVNIDAAIREVLEFTHGETMKSGTLVQTKLADGLRFIKGDRADL